MKVKNETFRVRNKKKEDLGTFSGKDILKKISSGKFTGDEEVATDPFEHWQKVSTHPSFYDAFIKRLYGKDYKAPEGEGSLSSSASIEGSSSGGETHRLEGDAPGATVHQSIIEELFKDPTGKKKVSDIEKESPEPKAFGEWTAVEAEIDKGDPPLGEGEEREPIPTEASEAVSQQEANDVEESPIAPRKRLWIGGALLVVVILFFAILGGGDDKKKDAALPQGIRQLIQSTAPKEEQVKSLLDEGILLANKDTIPHYRGAHKIFREAYDLDPINASVIAREVEVGARLFQKGDSENEITERIKRGRLYDVHNSGFYRTEALLQLFHGKFEESLASLSRAQDTDPTGPENILALGELNYKKGQKMEARKYFSEAAKGLPFDVRSRFLLGKVSFELGDLSLAQAAGIDALKLNPFHAATYWLLAEVASSRNQLEEARGLCENAGHLAKFTERPIVARVYMRLGKLRELVGDKAGAERAFRLAYHYDSSVDSALNEKVSGADLSRSSLEGLATQEEYDSEYFFEKGTEFLSNDKVVEATQFLEVAILLKPDDAKYLVRFAEALEKRADNYLLLRRVINVYERAIEKGPTDPAGFVKLGLLETEQFNFNRGFQLLKHAEALAPKDFNVLVALAKHYYKRKFYKEAVTYIMEAQKIHPQDSEVNYYGGLLMTYKKDALKLAINLLQAAYAQDSKNYDALVEWAKLKVVDYDKNFAVKYVRSLSQENPSNPNYYWALGEIYAMSKEHRRAILYYQKGLEVDPGASKLRLALARSYEAVGDLNRAVEEYQRASLKDRRNSEGFFKAAELVFQLKDYDATEKLLKHLLLVTPGYPGALRSLSRLYEETQKKDLATEYMEKEVANNPENLRYVLELAQLYMKYEQYSKAVEELKKVSSLPFQEKSEADKVRAYLLLSRCYRSLNKPESAEAAITLAVELDVNDPELQKELGYVYYSLHRDKEAVRAFESYLKRKPAAQDVQTIHGIITKIRIEP